MRDFYFPAIVAMAVAASVLATEIPAACPSVDLINETVHIGHENDPTKFYICVMGDKREMDCPEYEPRKKLCFNPELQQCDWPHNVARCKQHRDSRCPLDEHTTAVWAHPYNCRLFYTCKNDIMNLRSCDEGWLFDPKSGKCALAMDVVCNKPIECPPPGSSEIVLLPHECQCAKYYECWDGELILKKCDSGEMFDHNQRKCVREEEAVCNNDPVTEKPPPEIMCPPGNDTTDIPHETNCECYYTCENGRKQLQECPNGLYFDKIKGMCTWPENVNCGSRAFPTTILADTHYIDDVSLTVCPPEGSHENRTLPHECSCVKYYLCVNGAPTLQQCENGNEYDYIRRICDDPKNFKCIRPIPVAPTKISTSTTLAQIPENIKCPFEGGKKKIPKPHTCNSYYYCELGVVRGDDCLQGHLFNPKIEECDFVGDPNCTHFTPPPNCSGTCLVRNYDPENCDWYYECKNGVTEHKKCRTGLKFNSITGMCDLPDYVDCKKCTDTTEPEIYCTCPNTSGDKVAHECQRNKYYICENGNAIVQSCRPGYIYDRVKHDCIVAHNVVYGQSPNKKSQSVRGCSGTCLVLKPDTEDCAWYDECKNGHTEHKRCRKGLAFNPITEMCDWPEYVNCKKCTDTSEPAIYCTCPNTSGDKVAHECQCGKYYICENGNAIVKSCEPGYLYDRVKHDCDVADKVICSKSPNNKCEDPLGCIGTCPVHNSEHRPPVTYLPHEDCTNFCYCDNGTPLAYKCSEGFHFSKGEQKCTDPAIAQCVSSLNAKETSFWSEVPLIGKLFP